MSKRRAFSRIQNWEALALTNGSRLTLDGDLVMGDAGTDRHGLDRCD
jgi:hypothetical protein